MAKRPDRPRQVSVTRTARSPLATTQARHGRRPRHAAHEAPPRHPEPAGDYDPLERKRRRAPPAGKFGRYSAERHCPRGRD
jgi:hypothetical protein